MGTHKQKVEPEITREEIVNLGVRLSHTRRHFAGYRHDAHLREAAAHLGRAYTAFKRLTDNDILMQITRMTTPPPSRSAQRLQKEIEQVGSQEE